MELTVLGSGSSVQFENRASASFLIDTGKKKILLDAGFLLLDRLEKAGVMADEIDAVFISHKHPDHFMGFIHLLFALKNKYYSPKDELIIFGFKGLKDWYNSFREIMGHWIEPETRLVFIEDETGNIGDMQWRTFSTHHSEESLGIIIEANGKKLVYSGDTEYFAELNEIVSGAELFIAECGSSNAEKLKGHMSLDDIKNIAERVPVNQILLTHIYPETDKTPEEWIQGSTKFMRSCDLRKISL